MKKGILLIVGLLVMNLTVWAGNDKPIEVKKMPKAAQQFIQAYFGTHSVAEAKMETDFMSRSYDVIFTNGDKVEFDKKGNWKNVDCEQGEVPAAIIPEGIQMYLTQHYPNVKVDKIEKTDHKGYEVDLKNGIELEFNKHLKLVDLAR